MRGGTLRSIRGATNWLNDVAHGSVKGGLEEKVYAELEQTVGLVVDGLVHSISYAVANQRCLVAKNDPPSPG
jgi:hypothetical protein